MRSMLAGPRLAAHLVGGEGGCLGGYRVEAGLRPVHGEAGRGREAELHVGRLLGRTLHSYC